MKNREKMTETVSKIVKLEQYFLDCTHLCDILTHHVLLILPKIFSKNRQDVVDFVNF